MKQTISKNISEFEFIALMAFLMANVAMSIDSILPSLNQIGIAVNNTNSSDLQAIVTMVFLGLGVGQLVFGTLSDGLGRKPIVYAGIFIFIVASFVCINATTLQILLIGRFLQGIGLSAARTVSTSIIRDVYSGDYMARIMSFITVIFILVPMVAPVLGQFILHAYNWKAVFYFQIIFAFVIVVWFALRQKETLPKANRTEVSKALFFNGVQEFFKYKDSVVYTLVSGFITGSFIVFLSASKQVFQDQYGLIDEYVYIVAFVSFFLGLATFFNGKLVLRFGMRKLATLALRVFSFSALTYVLLFYNSVNPSVNIIVFFMIVQFFSLGFIFGNVRALSMEPIGHIAGVGAALSGFISTIISVPIATFIGSFINGTALPLFLGFFSCGFGSLMLIKSISKSSKGAVVKKVVLK